MVVLLRGALDGLAAVQPYGDPAFAGLRGPLALPEPGQRGRRCSTSAAASACIRALAELHGLYRPTRRWWCTRWPAPGAPAAISTRRTSWRAGADRAARQRLAEPRAAGLPGAARGAAPGLAVGTRRAAADARAGAGAELRPAAGAAPPPDLMARIAGLQRARPGDRPRRRARACASGGFAVATAGRAAGRAGAQPRRASRAWPLRRGGCWRRPTGRAWRRWNSAAGTPMRSRQPRLPGAAARAGRGLRRAAAGHWARPGARTAVLVVTEFGRTARVNGTVGTDHGTGGVAFLLGGAVAGGRGAGGLARPGAGAGCSRTATWCRPRTCAPSPRGCCATT